MENSAASRICTEEEATLFHEDSGWASYMEDLIMFDDGGTSDADINGVFSSSVNSETRRCCFSASHDGAESSASDKTHHQSGGLSRKRRKMTVEVPEDDDLEDTATSPAHPAISKMDRVSSKQKRLRERTSQQANAEHNKIRGSYQYGEVEDSIEVGFLGRDKYCSTGLKHIGLCLVPVSMAVNYFG